MSLFNRGFALAHDYPNDNVLTYIVRQVSSSTVDPDNWDFCESLLMKAAIAEPTALVVILEILDKNAGSISNKTNLTSTVASLCSYHAPLEQGYEVAWALWLAKQQNLSIAQKIAKRIGGMDDDIVALVALNLRDTGLFPDVPMPRWRKLMAAKHMYSEHWLLAYEAHEQGWLSSKTDYIAANPAFRRQISIQPTIALV